ncbi:hypothetical protein ACN4EK_08285 [Pantanalinema rosaneae CENA516]|uniref:hypothetical protein n=1 Tax=Pantanalinema rosaneae TaxID=1620701 RepID=UPI003D6E47D1
MNSDNVSQLMQKSLRVALGATASLVEVLQDPQKRETNLLKLQQEWSQLSEEWAQKGEVTEQEARNFMESLLNQPSHRSSTSAETTPSATTPSTSSTPPDVQVELQELTTQIAAIRAELEKLRNQE